MWIKVTGPVSFIHFSFPFEAGQPTCPYFFIDLDWSSCAMQLNFIGWWHLLLDFHWFFNCLI